MPPRLPRLPRLKGLPRPIEGLRGVVKGGREQLDTAVGDIHTLASDLRGMATEQPQTKSKATAEAQQEEEETSQRVKEGTACNLCSSEHFTQVSGDLAEALRFAREEGLTHPEVVRRVEHARQELNEMERYDLSPAEIQRLSGPERELAHWALPQSRNLRHLINETITTKEVSDLEKVAAQAETTANEFAKRLWNLPSTARECPECGDLQELVTYLKRRHQNSLTSTGKP